MDNNKYKDVEDFFKAPPTFRQKLILIKLQVIHELLSAWKFWKDKLIYIFIGVIFGWIIGMPFGAWLEHSNDKFWRSVILNDNYLENIKQATEGAEEAQRHLEQIQQELDEYWKPVSSPDIVRVSREE